MANNRGWKSWRNVKVSGGKIVGDSPVPVASKYHNIPCEANGIKFQSKRERDYYLNSILPRCKAGTIRWFLLQVPFRCGGGVTYRADFLEVWTDGSIHIIDVKGHRTQAFINKKKQVESLYPIRIEEKR